MSYVVIRSDPPGNSTFTEFAELEAAVEYLEKTCTGAGSTGARLCRLEPVDFEVKQYFKVEIPQAVLQVPSAVTASDPDEESDGPISRIDSIDEDRSLEPAPMIGRSRVPGESRRGLFGR